jgi:hypothetical protein
VNEIDPALMARVHHAFIEPLRRTGQAPSRAQVSTELFLTPDYLDRILRQLGNSTLLHVTYRDMEGLAQMDRDASSCCFRRSRID